jgi:DNA-directed RNA polymerase III subunit RPC1
MYKMVGRALHPVEKHLERITVGQLVEFCDLAKEKYERAKIEPGKNLKSPPPLEK